MKRGALRALGLSVALCAAPALAETDMAPDGTRHWNFEVLLDGRAIGMHRFTVAAADGWRDIESDARFDVRWLGLTLHRYRHRASERWQGDCLRELRSETDDDGTPRRVQQRHEAECLMGFAYWHPRMRMQHRLLNPQTGMVETVAFDRLGDARLPVRGQEVAALRWRLRAQQQEITIWYAAADGAWIGLDAQVAGGRLLTYRLR